jgi:RIO-like serine/threonine protein kinase
MYTVDGVEYTILDSFYRTKGSASQRLIRVTDIDNFNIDFIYKNKIFHIVFDKDEDYFFVKEYYTRKETAKKEFELTTFFGEINSNIIKTIGYEDGKIVYEFFDGTPLIEPKNIPLKRYYEITVEIYEFLLLIIENKFSHLFELHPNNVLVSRNPPYDYKIIDFESDIKRYKEFYNKNKRYLVMYKKVCDMFKKEFPK